jgi:hypothetical protein
MTLVELEEGDVVMMLVESAEGGIVKVTGLLDAGKVIEIVRIY